MQDSQYLQQALQLAQIRHGFCAPNPAVGAVIVRDNEILATGYHFAAGSPHAEIDALKKLSGTAKDATLYVTLEPCCHHGRTPPCTDAIIQAGIKRVVYAYRDVNPIVSGKGETILSNAGITCEHIASPEIDAFYESYQYWHTTKKPFITAKIAMSLDGKIAGKNSERIQLTGQESQEFTHQCRKNSDAILTTVQTIIHDDPQMNVRTQTETIAKPLYILDRQLRLPHSAKIFTTAKTITVFHSAKAPSGSQQQLIDRGVKYIAVEEDSHGLDLHQVISLIGQDGVHDLWVETGGKCFSALIRDRLLQQALIYVAPLWLGEGVSALEKGFSFGPGALFSWKQVGNDALCQICW